jgi:hypothetical protein
MLTTKFASNNSAHTIHAPRARVSQCRRIRLLDVSEDMGCDWVPGGNNINVLLMYTMGNSFRERDKNAKIQVPVSVYISNSILYLRLPIVTENVTDCQTSVTFEDTLIFFAQSHRVFQQSGF